MTSRMIKTNLITLILLILMVRVLSAESTIMSLTESPSFLSPSVSGFVVIKSNPTGAEVFINGKSTNKNTPFQIQLDAGTYRFTLKLLNYRDFEGDFIITDGQTISKDINMKPAFGSVSITSEPNGALIQLDGNPTNQKTPFTLEKISSGTHTITLSRDMYSDASQRIDVKDEQTSTIFLELLAGYGTIGIVAKPEAAIRIDGNIIATNNYAGRLSPGIHLVEIIKDKYYSQKKEIKMVAGDELKLNFQLEPILGNLSVMCEPVESEIYLDNLLVGKSPKMVQGISIGEHGLTLKKEGYVDIISKITIKENQTLSLTENMVKTLNINFRTSPTDASIYLNGNYGGKTPVKKTLAPGHYSLSFEKTYYSKNSFNVSFSRDTTLSITLTPAFDKINFTTKPDRVKVFVDEELKGMTPIAVDVQEGLRNLKLKKNGYKPLNQSITIDETKHDLNFTLEKYKSGGLAMFLAIIVPWSGIIYMGNESNVFFKSIGGGALFGFVSVVAPIKGGLDLISEGTEGGGVALVGLGVAVYVGQIIGTAINVKNYNMKKQTDLVFKVDPDTKTPLFGLVHSF